MISGFCCPDTLQFLTGISAGFCHGIQDFQEVCKLFKAAGFQILIQFLFQLGVKLLKIFIIGEGLNSTLLS